MEFEDVCIHVSAFSAFLRMRIFVVCLPPYLSMIRMLSLLFPVFLLLVRVFSPLLCGPIRDQSGQ